MKKFIVLAIVLMAFTQQKLMAQELGTSYRTAIGVKFYPGGVTLKHFVASNAALEFIGYFWERGSRITGLYEYHGNISDGGGLRWYIGPGAHVAFYNSKFFAGGQTVGIDGVLGLDLKLNHIPINLSIDWQPSYEFGDYNGFTSAWGGFAIRYTF